MEWARVTMAACAGMLALAGVAVHPQAAPDGPCAEPRLAQRRAWRTMEPARRQPGLTGNALVRHWPSAALGEWVVEIVRADDAEMTRVTPSLVTHLAWDRACAPSRTERTRPAVAPPRFTDADLVGLLGGTRRGVIYVWSPHMPLSADAIAPMTAAALALGLAVELVLDPAADRAFATRIAAERGLPSSALRAADSVELQFRDLLIHAPSVQVYAGGRLLGSAYPGGHTADEYTAYFRRVLDDQR